LGVEGAFVSCAYVAPAPSNSTAAKAIANDLFIEISVEFVARNDLAGA